MAANILLKAIENTVYVEGRPDLSNPNYAETQERIHSGAARKRVVFLG